MVWVVENLYALRSYNIGLENLILLTDTEKLCWAVAPSQFVPSKSRFLALQMQQWFSQVPLKGNIICGVWWSADTSGFIWGKNAASL